MLYIRTGDQAKTDPASLPPMRVLAFDPDIAACAMQEMMEESGVTPELRTLFVDTVIENNFIKAVIVENSSGRQAIERKVFIEGHGARLRKQILSELAFLKKYVPGFEDAHVAGIAPFIRRAFRAIPGHASFRTGDVNRRDSGNGGSAGVEEQSNSKELKYHGL
jgi:hypothetical protein